MNIDQLIREAGKLDYAKGTWLAPIILREQGADPRRIQVAEKLIEQRLWPDYPIHVGSDGTRTPDEHPLEYLQEAIVTLRQCGYRNDADRLLERAGDLATRYETHLGLANWHGRGHREPFRATLFATGKVGHNDPEVAKWGPEASALSLRVRSQFRREDEIREPIQKAVNQTEHEAGTFRNLRQQWTTNMRSLLAQNDSTQATRDLIDAANVGLSFDPTAADRWLRNAVAEGPNSHNFHLRAIDSAAAFFSVAGSLTGAQLVASIGRDFVQQAGIQLPADLNHPANNGVTNINGRNVQVGETNEIKTWLGFANRTDIASRLKHLDRHLRETARGEMGREVLIIAANLAWEGNPTSPAIAASREALRVAVSTAGKDLPQFLNQLGQGIAHAWAGLDNSQRVVLGKIIQQDVQRHPDVSPYRTDAPDHWVFGGEVTMTGNDGQQNIIRFVPSYSDGLT